ncbi:hypothetical protein GCK72_005354 [Caenorhabditis remanei]|uniref:Uncharacterized protein n=1 Tax=Caenorhabditis remanei TaxID=31234 RepID=A0A6A5HH39_CAERE|nr:hypothetical protein GCK72_005354 [Caenorhabditis remanei]KAF1765402.1 hypothetical protein GCK72_005354 [Caenorhabditis remanei]
MLEVRRASLVRQMAFRQDSNDSIHSPTRVASQLMFQPTKLNPPRPKRRRPMPKRRSDNWTIPSEMTRRVQHVFRNNIRI